VRRQLPAFFRRTRTQLERLPVEHDVVFVDELPGLDQADVAPRSDVVGPDSNRRRHAHRIVCLSLRATRQPLWHADIRVVDEPQPPFLSRPQQTSVAVAPITYP
jgi:hypothetical protein